MRKLATHQDKYRASLMKKLRNAIMRSEYEISRFNAEFCQAEKHEQDREQGFQLQNEKRATVEW